MKFVLSLGFLLLTVSAQAYSYKIVKVKNLGIGVGLEKLYTWTIMDTETGGSSRKGIPI